MSKSLFGKSKVEQCLTATNSFDSFRSCVLGQPSSEKPETAKPSSTIVSATVTNGKPMVTSTTTTPGATVDASGAKHYISA